MEHCVYHMQRTSAALLYIRPIQISIGNACKMATLEYFILNLGTRNYVEEVTYYTFFDVDRLSGASPQIGEI